MPRLSKIGAAALAAFGWTSGSAVTASYLQVAGGGGGGFIAGGNRGAGGGAGGFLTGTVSLNPTLSYTIVVGAGGTPLANGSNSTITGTGISITASVGGGAGGSQNGASSVVGQNGGSGGGGPSQSGSGSNAAGTGTVGQGNDGAAGTNAGGQPFGCGGGGGAGAVGTLSNNPAGAGGVGLTSSITGTSTYYAGGGGGGTYAAGPGVGGAGGLGGGGTGGGSGGNSTSGTANLGGGGGGAEYSQTSGSSGGSGVVIISYVGAQQFGGGVVTSSGGSTIHTFNTSGTLSPLSSLTASALIVAGGGGGSYDRGGGGGAGGLQTPTGLTIDTNSIYVVTVGSGGAGATTNANGSNGTNSSFSAYATASVGGGGGASYVTAGGSTGGSGGGGSYTNTGGAGTSGQGNAGGNGESSVYINGGGGGGAGAAGQTPASSANGGNGGNGSASSISGSSVTYAGGGGGGHDTRAGGSAGTGGTGGGGAGGMTGAGTAGTANLGGGGGGGGNNGGSSPQNGGAGGSGIVIISYAGSVQQMAGGTVTVAGGNVIHTFTSSGYLTPIVLVTNSLRFRSSVSAYLNRTPTNAGNRKTWTWSSWFKRGQLSTIQVLFGVGNVNTGTSFGGMYFTSTDTLIFYSPTTGGYKETTQVFRDPSAWYHLVVAYDTPNSVVKLYINGTEITAFSTNTNPSANVDGNVNQAVLHTIGKNAGASDYYFDGYMTEINFIDGQALTPFSFGTTSDLGVWQPIRYGGSYGTNGFYLKFTDTTNTTTLSYDYSPNGNNWTPNNISLTAGTTYDSMTDVPTLTSATVANYAVFNPINKSTVGGSTPSNGNLNVLLDRSSNNPWIQSTIAFPSSGKWYLEYSQTSIDTTSTPYNMIGVMDVTTPISTEVASVTGLRGYYLWNGNKRSGTTVSSYGSGTALNDIIGVAVDMDSGKIWFAVNNTWVNSGSPTGGTNAAFTDLTGTTWSFFNSILGETTSNSWVNFGQRPFTYTPPAGFVALNTFNLPTPTIGATASTTANEYFDVTTYTGNGTTQSITNSGSMQPDWVWLKCRSTNYRNQLYDSVRGATKALFSDSTDAEGTFQGVTAFNANGFSLGAELGANASGDTFVGWQWRASNAAAVANTAGTIPSLVSASTTAGFSIVTYTGNGTSGATVGHGLGVAPSMYIVKTRSTTESWITYHISIGATNYLALNLIQASSAATAAWNNTAPTSTVFSLGNAGSTNGSGNTFVAYCFAPVAGYSAFGSYTGNGSTDGPFVFLGFRPRWIMIKSTVEVSNWLVWDTSRSPYNAEILLLYPSLSNAEGSDSTYGVDGVSNGFKIRGTGQFGGLNNSGNSYIYACFAETPLKFANAR